MTKLMREHQLNIHQLDGSHLSDCRLVSAKETITALTTQLKRPCCDLVNSENKAANLHLKPDVAKQKLMRQSANVSMVSTDNQRTKASQTTERDIAELSLQLQRAHQDLEK